MSREDMMRRLTAKYELTEDEANEVKNQLESLRALLTQPQRVQMADMVHQFFGEPGGHPDDPPPQVRHTARAIRDTFANVRSVGSVDGIFREVAKRRFLRAKIAAEVPRRNWVAEYRMRADQTANAWETVRQIQAWTNPFMPAEVTWESIAESAQRNRLNAVYEQDLRRDVPPFRAMGPAKYAELRLAQIRAARGDDTGFWSREG